MKRTRIYIMHSARRITAWAHATIWAVILNCLPDCVVLYTGIFFLHLLQEFYSIMRSAFWLRAELLPYTYSQAREAYDEGILTLMQIKKKEELNI